MKTRTLQDRLGIAFPIRAPERLSIHDQPISELAGYAPDSEVHGEGRAKQRRPGSMQQFPLRSAPACTGNVNFAKEKQAVASKTKLVVWQRFPLNDSAGGQNAAPANEKTPRR